MSKTFKRLTRKRKLIPSVYFLIAIPFIMIATFKGRWVFYVYWTVHHIDN